MLPESGETLRASLCVPLATLGSRMGAALGEQRCAHIRLPRTPTP